MHRNIMAREMIGPILKKKTYGLACKNINIELIC